MEDVQATAKWANRMLRPLTSIYRRLEKHQETLSIIAAESRAREPPKGPNAHAPSTTQSASAQDIGSGSDADENDPVWIPGKKPAQRRVRRKYSSRGEDHGGRRRNRLSMHSPEAPRTLPGAIEVATPLITGKRWEPPSSARSQLSAQKTRSIHSEMQLKAFRDRYPLHKSPWQELLDQSGDSGFADIAHNLDRVLQNFLYNTRIPKRDASHSSPKPSLGTRSLVSMVVRRLPEFIASEQEAQDEMDEDGDEDMCDAYFTELEAFYAPHGRGWRPLREAVRAQGIYLVATMIQNQWVPDAVACALIEKCRYHETDACESLLATFLSICQTYPYPLALKPSVDRSSPGDPVRLLRSYAHHGVANRSYIFDELAKLLLRGVLPPEWMATKQWTSWMARAAISFSKGDVDSAAASRLIEAVLVSASGAVSSISTTNPIQRHSSKSRAARGQGKLTWPSSTVSADDPDLKRACPVPVEDALSNHVMSLMAAVCGMHISRSREANAIDCVDGTKASHIISYLSFVVERDIALRPLSRHPEITSHQLSRRGCIVVAHCLLKCNDAVLSGNTQYEMAPTPSLDECSQTLASRPDLIKELVLFMRQAFRYFGGTTDSEQAHTGREIRRMVSRLPRMTDASGLSALLGRIAAESAMEFAESTGDPDDHVWAVEIQETVVAVQNEREPGQQSMNDLEDPGRKRGLYRWEESIGEWVARTPAVKTKTVPVNWVRGRVSMTPESPCIPCSTDSSSPGSDRFEQPASSLTSPPSSVATKRTIEDPEPSPPRPAKRRRRASVVIENDGDRSGSLPASTSPRSTPVESVYSRRRILREMSNPNIPSTAPKRTRSGAKIEVVVINKKETDSTVEGRARPAPEPVEKQVHRMVERRRPGRPPVSAPPMTVAPSNTPRRPLIPCSEGEDSDDELSFM